jgi:Prp8 binding protein
MQKSMTMKGHTGKRIYTDMKLTVELLVDLYLTSFSFSVLHFSKTKDTITCLSLNPKGTHILSNSMDSTLRTWDIRPFVDGGKKRHDKTFVGGTHNAEKGLLNCAWSPDGSMVTGGSADRIVHIWDELSGEELYSLPGHAGCVNAVVFHPKENVIASASSDKSIFVGELSS